jgi:hypothetical protein
LAKYINNKKRCLTDEKKLSEIIEYVDHINANDSRVLDKEWLRKELNYLEKEIHELIRLNLRSARRLSHQQYKDFAYGELEKITEQNHERV